MKYKRVKELESGSCQGCIFDQEGCQNICEIDCCFGIIFIEDKKDDDE